MIDPKLQGLFIGLNSDEQKVVFAAYGTLLLGRDEIKKYSDVEYYTKELNDKVVIDWDLCNNTLWLIKTGIRINPNLNINDVDNLSAIDIMGVNTPYISLLSLINQNEDLFKRAYKEFYRVF